ncbi:hypothetical protein C6P40_004667 [Pichia californica]|uniref:C2H2-type domain-containing protein n=1 Tax=Pichia californica TaxID=460514 RepID=A0A9P6WM66_9ASCO|nr:hypothetical protein C6P42_005128 [[Candida] californica]KAG0689676.1 hypothetical protein C6P40_004667 [[Candida] californica]
MPSLNYYVSDSNNKNSSYDDNGSNNFNYAKNKIDLSANNPNINNLSQPSSFSTDCETLSSSPISNQSSVKYLSNSQSTASTTNQTPISIPILFPSPSNNNLSSNIYQHRMSSSHDLSSYSTKTYTSTSLYYNHKHPSTLETQNPNTLPSLDMVLNRIQTFQQLPSNMISNNLRCPSISNNFDSKFSSISTSGTSSSTYVCDNNISNNNGNENLSKFENCENNVKNNNSNIPISSFKPNSNSPILNLTSPYQLPPIPHILINDSNDSINTTNITNNNNTKNSNILINPINPLTPNKENFAGNDESNSPLSLPQNHQNNIIIDSKSVNNKDTLLVKEIENSDNVTDNCNRKYKCKICSRGFTTSGHLARHNRIHTGVKNHICPFDGCNSKFSRQDNCMQHYKTHLRSKKSKKKLKIPNKDEI